MNARAGAIPRLVLELIAYNLILTPLLPLLAGWMVWRMLVLRKPIGRWAHRLGFVPGPRNRKGPRIWVHAVSAGEMGAARPVLVELRRRFPEAAVSLSTHTNTGMEIASRSCPEADTIFYFPFDCPVSIAIALLRVRPELVVIVEKELWPNFLLMARLLGARVLAVNGRVSDRMVRRARLSPTLVRQLYRLVDVICVQSAQDAKRLSGLGISSGPPPVIVAGNTKADTLAARDTPTEDRLKKELSVGDSELWLVAGSTHPGESEQIVDAFVAIREQAPSVRLLLAPRHLERLPAVSAMLAQRGLQVARRSEGRQAGSDAVVVLDTMGELRAAYTFATAAFVGGTFVPIGGHNLLEPAAVGTPVLFGPHTENCADTAELLLDAGVGFRVEDAAQLVRQFLTLARDGELRTSVARRAERLVEQQRGASARCVDAAAELLVRREGR